jgi:hypothetical protein
MGSLQKFKEFLKVVVLVVSCFGIPVIAWSLVRIVRGTPDSKIQNPTYAELVAIILTAVTVVLAVLAIIVAILAVWGYRDIKKEAASAAQRAIEATVEKNVTQTSLQKLVDDHITRLFRKQTMASQASAYPQAYSNPYSTDPPEKVAIEYPKEGGEKHEG